MKYTICCLISILSGNFLCAQTTVKGVVLDSVSNPLPQINIIVTPIDSDDIVAYTYTKTTGEYTLGIEKEGVYKIIYSSLNFAKQTIEIEITDSSRDIVLDILMKEQQTQLNEILLLANRPITVKKDTIIFDAKAFARGNETVVEDLLRNIPGLEVDSDGLIKIGGREVEKVMVDYDDFFDKGYRILTKNMQADAIDKIEILEKYSNNHLLKGVENSDKVALNLTLKEDKRNIWFGNASLGYGIVSQNRYDVSSNVMSFGKKNKYYFLTSLNNTGTDVSGDISYVISPSRFDQPGTLGDNQKVSSILNLTAYNTGLKQQRTNFNNVELLSLNSIFTLSPKLKLKALGLFNTDENDFFKNGFETFLFNEQTFTNTEDYTLRKKQFTGFGQIDLTYNISKTTMFEYVGKYNNTRKNTNRNLRFNEEYANEFLKESNKLIDQKAVYTNKYKDNKVLVFTGRFIDEKIPQDYTINQFFFEELFPETGAQTLVQEIDNTMLYAGFEGHLLEKKANGNLLELKAGYTSRTDYLNSQLYLKDEQNILTAPQNFANQLKYTTNNLYLKSGFIYKFNSLLINTNLELHQFYNTLNFKASPEITEQPFLINPKLGFEWIINDKNRLAAAYNYNYTSAKILDVYDSYILTSFRSFMKGTGEFNQLNSSNYNLTYRLGNWSDKFFAHTSMNYTKNHNFFTTSAIIQPSFTQSTKILIKDREMFNGNINLERYFKSISTNLKVKTGFVKSNYENIVNFNERKVDFSNYNYGLEIRSGFSGMFNYNLGTAWTHNRIITGIENSFTNNESFLNITFVPNKYLSFQLEAERYYFGNLIKGEENYNFLDFDVKYTVLNSKLIFSLEGRNLFNTQVFRNYSISDISISNTEIRLLPRFVLLKMNYRF